MKDKEKTKEQLIGELVELRERVSELERANTERKRAEEALRKSESKYRELVEKATLGIVITAKGKVVFCNKRESELFGCQNASDLCGRSLTELIREDDLPRLLKLGEQVRRGEAMASPVAFRGIRCDGRELVLEGFAIPFPFEGEDAVLSFHIDITERKRAEEGLRDSEERYRAIFEQAADSIVLIDAETGALVEFNERAHESLGYTRQEFQNLKIPDFEVIESAEEVAKHIEKIVKEETDTFETKHRTKDGELRDILVSSRAISIGERDFIQSIWRDITERKRAAQALRQSQQLLKRAFSSLRDAVFVIDADTVEIIDCNPAASEIFGYSRDEMLGRTTTFLHVDEAALEEFRGHLYPAIEENGFLSHLEFRMKRKDGTVFPTEHSVMPLEDEEGKRIGWVSVVRDVTERKRAEEEKEKMQAQLLQSQKMEAIGMLSSGVAHDFNNLLGAILGYAELAMMEADEADPLYGNLERIVFAAERGASLTRQLLLFSRKEPMKPTLLNINRRIDHLLEMLKPLIGEDIAINIDLEPDPWTVRADGASIEQVIMNLAVNAREAMPKGGDLTIKTENVTLDEARCKSIPEARPGRHVCLSVVDTGVGMDEEIMQHIFEPFFTTKEVGKGLGLGLPVVYGIVKQHEGWINVYSEPGQGSMFQIYLPALAMKPEYETEETISLEKLQGSGERILLVEDEEGVREFLTRALSENGYIVFEAANAKEALDIFEREKGNFHLVFADVVLPDLSGLELVDQLLSRNPQLRVLLSSGYTDDKSQWPVIRERGFPFLQKPYALADLLRVIREIIEPT